MKKLGKPLPPVQEITPPDVAEIDAIIALWNANAPLYYQGLLEAELMTDTSSKARFIYDRAKMQYIHRKSGRVLARTEIARAFIEFYRKVG